MQSDDSNSNCNCNYYWIGYSNSLALCYVCYVIRHVRYDMICDRLHLAGLLAVFARHRND